jgi:hypothetical protein
MIQNKNRDVFLPLKKNHLYPVSTAVRQPLFYSRFFETFVSKADNAAGKKNSLKQLCRAGQG